MTIEHPLQRQSEASTPVRGTPDWRSQTHGHGDGCPIGRCPNGKPSWGCPEFIECGQPGCLCEYRSL